MATHHWYCGVVAAGSAAQGISSVRVRMSVLGLQKSMFGMGLLGCENQPRRMIPKLKRSMCNQGRGVDAITHVHPELCVCNVTWLDTILLALPLAGEMVLLLHWSLLNYAAVVKILKKHDKRTGLLLRAPYLANVLQQVTPSCEDIGLPSRSIHTPCMIQPTLRVLSTCCHVTWCVREAFCMLGLFNDSSQSLQAPTTQINYCLWCALPVLFVPAALLLHQCDEPAG